MAISKVKDSNQYLLEAANSLTKAQMLLTQKLDSHILSNEKKFAVIESKLNKHENMIDTLYIDYVKRLKKEVAKYYKMPQSDITYEHVKAYREIGKYSYDLSMNEIRSRTWRICYLKCIKGVPCEFFSTLYTRIGLTEKQIRMEPYAIAVYFNGNCNRQTIYSAIEQNKEYMKIATELIFEIEDKYGIDDKDMKHRKKLKDEIAQCYSNMSSKNDSEYINWFNKIVKEYMRLCRATKNEAIKTMFNLIEIYINRHKDDSDKHRFSGDLIPDLHVILSDERMRKSVPNILHNGILAEK